LPSESCDTSPPYSLLLGCCYRLKLNCFPQVSIEIILRLLLFGKVKGVRENKKKKKKNRLIVYVNSDGWSLTTLLVLNTNRFCIK